jgi:hypothetical protein
VLVGLQARRQGSGQVKEGRFVEGRFVESQRQGRVSLCCVGLFLVLQSKRNTKRTHTITNNNNNKTYEHTNM